MRILRSPILIVVTLLVAGLAGPLALAQDQTPEPEVGIVVSTHGINVRECPRADCAVIEGLSLGDTLTVLGPPEDGFIPVSVGGRRGWAFSLFVASTYTGTPVLTNGTPGCKRVALIFNVGKRDWNDPMSWEIINFLINEQVPATMFIRAWWVSYYPAWVKEFTDNGFTVGIHGNEGLTLEGRTTEEILAEIEDAEQRIEAATGQRSDPVFTPADLDGDPRVFSIIAFAGYLPVFWQVEAGDGHDRFPTAEDVRARILDGVYDGAIIELHLDSSAGVSATSLALPGVVSTLRGEGYTFVSIPDMAQPC